MIIRNFWAYVLGYLVLVVQGEHPEHFINLAITRGIPLWDLVRVDRQLLLVRVYARYFAALRHVARRTGCRLRIRFKRGLPFLLYRLRKRQMLVGGGVLFCLLVFLLSSLVWTVEVEGTRRVSPALVKRLAAAAGLRPGVWRYQVQGGEVADYLVQQLPGVAFAEVEVRVRSRIRIVERAVTAPANTPCDIVASKDGVVESLMVLAGSPQVKEGDLVRRGEVLISGAVRPPAPEVKPGEQQPRQPRQLIRYVAARGLVRARIWYRGYGEAQRTGVEELRTGRTTSIVCLKMGPKQIIIKGPRRIPYLFYDLKVRRVKIPKWRDITFPVEFVTIEADEIRRVRLHRSQEDALRLAVEKASRQLQQRLPAGVPVAKRSLRVLETGETVRVVVTAETLEEIGRTRRLKPRSGSSIPPEQAAEGRVDRG